MASNNIFQKAEDWLDDLETVGTYAAEKIGSVTKDMPIVKSLGAIAANPTRQEIGAQVSSLASATNKGLQESFGGDPVDMALNYGPGAIGAMTAFHGTPHKIVGGFKKSAIGTGEGNQAFGHGFYATDSKAIAQHYQELLSSGGNPLLSSRVKEAISAHGGDEKKALAYIKEAIDNTSGSNKVFWETAYNNFDELKTQKGHIYKLDIPEPDVMLDWDKPFNEQPEKVKKAIENWYNTPTYEPTNIPQQWKGTGTPISSFFKSNPTGAKIYAKMSGLSETDAFTARESAGKASEELSKLGIKGIRYKAGQISGAKTDASNYVIFEPEDIKILAEDFLDQ